MIEGRLTVTGDFWSCRALSCVNYALYGEDVPPVTSWSLYTD